VFFSGTPGIDLPFTNRVLVFAIAILIFLLAPLFLKKLRLPGIIGVMLIGVLIGPHVLNILSRGRTIRLLGKVGLLYLLFVSGLEIDMNEVTENPNRIAVFALITFLLPMILGTVGGITILDFSLLSAILFAAMFSSHTILSYPVLEQLDILKNTAVTTTVSVALLTDTAALLILAVVETVHSQHGQAGVIFWAQFGAKLAVFFVGIWVVVPRIGRWFFRNVDEESYFEYLFTLAVVFVTAYLATLAGADPIIGAFLAGLTMNRLVPSTSTLMNRIQFVGNALFIPFFFLSMGMLVQPRAFLGVKPWIITGLMIGVMFGMKLVAAVAAGHIYEFEQYEWLTMFGISTGQGPAAIAIALIGVQSGLFSQTLVNAVVFMIIVSGVISPYLTERFGRGIVEIEEEQEYEPSEAPQRILIPLTEYTDNTESLLDLAMLLHESEAEEPIRALTVVQRESQNLDVGNRYTNTDSSESNGNDTQEQQPDNQQPDNQESDNQESDDQQTEAEVADAEETLEETEEQAVSAEIPIETLTRVVGRSIPDGISQAIEENRITTVIMGWNNQRRFGQRLFGNTIDQLLQRTNELLVIANLTEPLNTTERLLVVLPGRIAAHPGFHEGIHLVHQAADQLGISAHYLLVNGNTDVYESRIESIEPDVPFDIEPIDGWSGFRSEAEEQFDEGDFVVALTPREGTRGWDSHLDDLPQRLATHAPENVSIVYLPEESKARPRRFLEVG
jgi:Kef-type K+ transport system membrane component KefB/nucleotide-binding universal stress UspA family protein